MSAFYRKINQQQQVCRRIKQIFTKLVKSSFQPPLQKALSNESTYIIEHINRLKLIKSLLVSLKVKTGKPLIAKRIKEQRFLVKSKSNPQDEQIIKFALRLFELMNKELNVIKELASSIAQPVVKTLIEQSIKENEDSIRWLCNIKHNVLAVEC